MSEKHEIVKEVYLAKADSKKADVFIKKYTPFIKSETAKFSGGPINGSLDDEFSIAMMAFYEAIKSYSSDKGAFLSFAAVVIKNRLTDFVRKETKHKNVLSLDFNSFENGENPMDKLSVAEDYAENHAVREATKSEIEELSLQLKSFGVSLSDIADNCPRQQKTLISCRKALLYARENPDIFSDFLRTKRLPIAKLSKGCSVERKTLERHRKYLVGLMLVFTNGYEIIRGHLKYVLKGENEK